MQYLGLSKSISNSSLQIHFWLNLRVVVVSQLVHLLGSLGSQDWQRESSQQFLHFEGLYISYTLLIGHTHFPLFQESILTSPISESQVKHNEILFGSQVEQFDAGSHFSIYFRLKRIQSNNGIICLNLISFMEDIMNIKYITCITIFITFHAIYL